MLLSWKKDKDVQELLNRLRKEGNLDFEAIDRIDYRIYNHMLRIMLVFAVPLIAGWYADGINGKDTYVEYFTCFFLILLLGIFLQLQKTFCTNVLVVNDGVTARGNIIHVEKWTGRYFTFYGWLYWCEFMTKDQQKIKSFHKFLKTISKEAYKEKQVDVLYLAEKPEQNTLAFPKMIEIYNLKKVRT